MAPSTKAIEAALRSAVERQYAEDADILTVKYIRSKVESELELGDGFLVTEEWKDKSKVLIKEWAVSFVSNIARLNAENLTWSARTKS